MTHLVLDNYTHTMQLMTDSKTVVVQYNMQKEQSDANEEVLEVTNLHPSGNNIDHRNVELDQPAISLRDTTASFVEAMKAGQYG